MLYVSNQHEYYEKANRMHRCARYVYSHPSSSLIRQYLSSGLCCYCARFGVHLYVRISPLRRKRKSNLIRVFFLHQPLLSRHFRSPLHRLSSSVVRVVYLWSTDVSMFYLIPDIFRLGTHYLHYKYSKLCSICVFRARLTGISWWKTKALVCLHSTAIAYEVVNFHR